MQNTKQPHSLSPFLYVRQAEQALTKPVLLFGFLYLKLCTCEGVGGGGFSIYLRAPRQDTLCCSLHQQNIAGVPRSLSGGRPLARSAADHAHGLAVPVKFQGGQLFQPVALHPLSQDVKGPEQALGSLVGRSFVSACDLLKCVQGPIEHS